MLSFFLDHQYLIAIIVFFGSFACCYIVMPSVISVANYKNLMADSNHRSSHVQQTPTLGGISFFICIMMGLFFLHPMDPTGMSTHLMAAVTILFIVGLKDDLTILSARTKFLAQLLAIGFVLLEKGMIVENLQGFLGIYEIPLLVSVGGATFLIVAIINSYNLIDGIDGLAGGIGTLISLCFATVFFVVGIYFYAFVALISAGYLIGFLRFNLSSKRKIFMGDTGSLIAGFVLGVLAIRVLALDAGQIDSLHIQPGNLFVLVGSVLFLPFIDTIRVFSLRILKGNSPFRPDKNHIHHLLLQYGLSHVQSSSLLIALNLAYITAFYFLNMMLHPTAFFFLFALSGIIVLLVLAKYNMRLKEKSAAVVNALCQEEEPVKAVPPSTRNDIHVEPSLAPHYSHRKHPSKVVVMNLKKQA